MTTLAGMKYTLTPRGVSIVDADQYGCHDYEGMARPGESAPSDRWYGHRAARRPGEWLTSKGVRFNAGSSAAFFAPVGRQKMSLGSNGVTTSSVFLPASGKLVVRNTQDQLDLIDTILAAGNLSTPDDQASKLEDSQGISGLLPMKLDLPKIWAR